MTPPVIRPFRDAEILPGSASTLLSERVGTTQRGTCGVGRRRAVSARLPDAPARLTGGSQKTRVRPPFSGDGSAVRRYIERATRGAPFHPPAGRSQSRSQIVSGVPYNQVDRDRRSDP